MRKAAICNSLLRYFVEQVIFDEREVEYLEQSAMRKLEIEEKQKDREIEERQKDIKIEEKQKNREQKKDRKR